METLRLQGWSIDKRNFRGRGFEIDIIASKHETLSFVEVKLRKRPVTTNYEFFGLMSRQKRRAMYRGSQYYLFKNKITMKKIRFDLVVVYQRNRIQYLDNISI